LTHSFSLRLSPPPTPTLFPYTTLFRSDHLFVAEPERRRHDRDLSLQPGGGELPVERDVIAADQERHDDVGLRALHPLDHRVKVEDRKSTRLNSSHVSISYAVFCLKKKT